MCPRHQTCEVMSHRATRCMPPLGQPSQGKGAPLQEAIQKPFEARQGAGRWRLMHLLRQVMIRAAKSDLITIPPCHTKVSCGDETAHTRNRFPFI